MQRMWSCFQKYFPQTQVRSDVRGYVYHPFSLPHPRSLQALRMVHYEVGCQQFNLPTEQSLVQILLKAASSSSLLSTTAVHTAKMSSSLRKRASIFKFSMYLHFYWKPGWFIYNKPPHLPIYYSDPSHNVFSLGSSLKVWGQWCDNLIHQF